MSGLNSNQMQSFASLQMKVYDGKFKDKTIAPYFYITHHDDVASTTVSFPATETSAAQLRGMADQLEEYWADWDAQNEKEPAA